MEQLYPGDHAANPSRVMYGSENHHTLAAWRAVEQNDYIAGQFLWTGIDYLGEAGIWPSHGSGAGLINLAGFPKNQYYFRKSLWADAPMVYLSTSGLFAGRGADEELLGAALLLHELRPRRIVPRWKIAGHETAHRRRRFSRGRSMLPAA